MICRTHLVREGERTIRTDLDSPQTTLVGIYAGRLSDDMDIGVVWRPHVLTELLSGVCEPEQPRRFNAHLVPDEEVFERRAFHVDFDAPAHSSTPVDDAKKRAALTDGQLRQRGRIWRIRYYRDGRRFEGGAAIADVPRAVPGNCGVV